MNETDGVSWNAWNTAAHNDAEIQHYEDTDRSMEVPCIPLGGWGSCVRIIKNSATR